MKLERVPTFWHWCSSGKFWYCFPNKCIINLHAMVYNEMTWLLEFCSYLGPLGLSHVVTLHLVFPMQKKCGTKDISKFCYKFVNLTNMSQHWFDPSWSKYPLGLLCKPWLCTGCYWVLCKSILSSGCNATGSEKSNISNVSVAIASSQSLDASMKSAVTSNFHGSVASPRAATKYKWSHPFQRNFLCLLTSLWPCTLAPNAHANCAD